MYIKLRLYVYGTISCCFCSTVCDCCKGDPFLILSLMFDLVGLFFDLLIMFTCYSRRWDLSPVCMKEGEPEMGVGGAEG